MALIDPGWLPNCKMERIVFHWTAGSWKASANDKNHYHLLIEGDGTIVRGAPSIDKNSKPVKNGYAAHTLNCNGGSIGVAVCGMLGATETPFSPGKYPITENQVEKLFKVLAELCEEYDIGVGPKTLLSHAEVQQNLGIKQRGKWDISRLPSAPNLRGAKAVGEYVRGMVEGILAS